MLRTKTTCSFIRTEDMKLWPDHFWHAHTLTYVLNRVLPYPAYGNGNRVSATKMRRSVERTGHASHKYTRNEKTTQHNLIYSTFMLQKIQFNVQHQSNIYINATKPDGLTMIHINNTLYKDAWATTMPLNVSVATNRRENSSDFDEKHID